MANLTPTAAWSDVYKIETTDWVDASRTGVSNAQAQSLLNRLQYLYNRYLTLYNKMNSYDDPVGTVKLWYKSLAELPAGWQLCDGTNGTPDLRNRYAKGTIFESLLSALPGGAATISFQFTMEGYDKNHTHTATCGASPLHEHSLNVGDADGYLGDNLKWGDYGSYAANGHTHVGHYIHPYDTNPQTHSHSISVASAGAHSHIVNFSNVNNLPASVAIYYVMKIS